LLVFGILWQPSTGINNLLKHTKTIILPSTVIVLLYFAATYLLKGHFIGHYGEAHLRFEPVTMLGTFWQYIAKLLGYVHYYPGHTRMAVYSAVTQPWAALTFLFVLAIIYWGLLRYRKHIGWFSLGWLGTIVAL